MAEPGPQDGVCGWGRWMPSTSWLATTILSPSPALCAHRTLGLNSPTHSSHLCAHFFFFFFSALLVLQASGHRLRAISSWPRGDPRASSLPPSVRGLLRPGVGGVRARQAADTQHTRSPRHTNGGAACIPYACPHTSRGQTGVSQLQIFLNVMNDCTDTCMRE